VPKRSASQGAPRRRRPSADAAEAPDAGRNVVMQLLLHSPKDTVAVGVAVVTVCAIMGNALFFQSGRHPAPMFGMALPIAAPATKPVPRSAAAVESRQPQNRADAPATGAASDPLTNLVKATTAGSSRPSPARRIAAVQRALARYGFGQVSATGTITPETRGAIREFEAAHKMPVTGQVSDRLISQLTAEMGPLE